jgi:hypothetical protein
MPGQRKEEGYQRLQLTEVGGNKRLIQNLLCLRAWTTVEKWWYLGWSMLGSCWFVNVFFVNCSFTTKSTGKKLSAKSIYTSVTD